MNQLPVDEVLPELLRSLGTSGRLVLRAPPGSGKTTRVALSLLDSDLTGDGVVLLLQPRRAAARSVARYLARVRGGRLGAEVGYQVRFDSKVSSQTRLKVVTEGILIRMLQGDPELSEVSAVLFDEFHERSLNADLGLGLIQEVRETIRPDLLLIVMSATLDVGPVAEHLGACPVIETSGRAYPITMEYEAAPDDRPVDRQAAAAVRRLAVRMDAGEIPRGHILVFLPGAREIDQTARALAPWARDSGWEIAPLHGSMRGEEQDAALATGARPRVIVSTNIAETSLTIDGVTAVVDSGLVRILRHDRGVGLDRLELERTSRASADQRAGRAGRQGPGIACRLYPTGEDRSRSPDTDPEIRRVDLSGVVLQLAAWGLKDPAAFPFLDPPPEDALKRARDLLTLLGALEEDGRITSQGLEMSRMPAHPRVARMLLAARDLHLVPCAAWAGALLQGRPLRTRPDSRSVGGCDLSAQIIAIAEGEHEGHRRTLGQVAKQLARCVGGQVGSAREAAAALPGEGLGRIVLAGWPDRVCRRVADGGAELRMVGGHGAQLHASSRVRDDALVVAPRMDAGRRGERSRARVWMACSLEQEWLNDLGVCVQEETLSWDGERVITRRVLRFSDLVLDERTLPMKRKDEASSLMAREVAKDPERLLRLQAKDREVMRRLALLAEHVPSLGIPPDPVEWLKLNVDALCQGATSLNDLHARPAGERLLRLLDWQWREAMDRQMPTTWEAPSGGRLKVHYPQEGPPRVEVKIQEVFGLDRTPQIAGGRVPLSLHLLNPAGRPVQVTSDLKSFWTSTWPEVRREMRSRYPKHRWPEDPSTAPPSRSTLKRRGGAS